MDFPRTLIVTQRVQSGEELSGANLIALYPNCRHKQETTKQLQRSSNTPRNDQGGQRV